MNKDSLAWEFWIDRGGTFTDIVACHRRQTNISTATAKTVTLKLLSEDPESYHDPAVEGIRRILNLQPGEPINPKQIAHIKMGTTIATNALLERTGAPVALVVTNGFSDLPEIGDQTRPHLFKLDIETRPILYQKVIAADERIGSQGEILKPLHLPELEKQLQQTFKSGIRSVAISLMNAYRNPQHEMSIASLCRDIGFTQISCGHEVSPLIKYVPRTETAIADAYLSPILREYIRGFQRELTSANPDRTGQPASIKLYFMQSSGGLAEATHFRGKDAVLSGPAGGVVGMVETARGAGYQKIIGFDMGGTSTDVAHYNGAWERSLEREVAGIHMRVPMMNIHTVAAGGGSICEYRNGRFQVGPHSAGANPGPASYRKGGPLTLTDCNLFLGRIRSEYFPQVFGPQRNQPLDPQPVRQCLLEIQKLVQQESSTVLTLEEIAEGFLNVAVENMALAIKTISVKRGYDVSKYLLNCFGGAGGQHATRIADSLGIREIMIHRYAGVLSAYGIGMSKINVIREKTLELPFHARHLKQINQVFQDLRQQALDEVVKQGAKTDRLVLYYRVYLRYHGSDLPMPVEIGKANKRDTKRNSAQIISNENSLHNIKDEFESKHKARFGFHRPGTQIDVFALSVEATESPNPKPIEMLQEKKEIIKEDKPIADSGSSAPVYHSDKLGVNETVAGPALLIDQHSTIVLEPDWSARRSSETAIILTRPPARAQKQITEKPDPIRLEIFNNLFMNIAEQMGAVLENCAHSVNIKERRDFSCALFDEEGCLVANAPHIPVHLGSMSETVKSLIHKYGNRIKPGDAYVTNDPHDGGTHLPDVTVITPVFDPSSAHPLFFVASRGHHADIGGKSPGSMPPNSASLSEEGILIPVMLLQQSEKIREKELRALFTDGPWPARNPDQNIADILAQVAANHRGAVEIGKMIEEYTADIVRSYMKHVQNNAAQSAQKAIRSIQPGSFRLSTDHGCAIQVRIKRQKPSNRLVVDFTGTSPRHPGNLNAPKSVVRAAVIYVIRCLIDSDIPLNEGVLQPVRIIIPENSLLNPGHRQNEYKAPAVAAGNVETSQAVVDAMLGALNIQAGSQGTMNNLTFGNKDFQYYETLCGGSGAGYSWNGRHAVHTHMTNSRLTDPEIFESRYPAIIERFEIRRRSGGDGRYRGGDGAIREIRFTCPVDLSLITSNRVIAPFGLEKGMPGLPGKNLLIRKDGKTFELRPCESVSLEAGDTLRIETPGGGGYGKPLNGNLNVSRGDSLIRKAK